MICSFNVSTLLKHKSLHCCSKNLVESDFLNECERRKLLGGSWARDTLLGGFLGFNSLQSPILGFWLIPPQYWPAQFSQMKPCKSVDYFIKVNFHVVVDRERGESSQSCLLSNYSYVFSWKSNDVSNARQKKSSKPFSFFFFIKYLYIGTKFSRFLISCFFAIKNCKIIAKN